MSRPPVEVADIIRAAGDAFFDGSRKWLTWFHVKALTAILYCRTSALGGHVDACSRCDYQAISYNSCRNRHCPKCQTNARDRWLEARCRDLLPVPYVHVVFTLPHELAPLALQNKREIYGLLFRASAETLLQVARNPKHLGAEIGFFSILHTWNQQLLHHPHVHCVVPAGGLSPNHCQWIPAANNFFLPVRVLSRLFRGKFVAGLRRLHAGNKLAFHGKLRTLQSPKTFSAMLRSLFRADLGGLFQAPVWRRRACAALSRLLHPSHCDFQSPARFPRKGPGYFPVARFCPQKQEEDDVADCRRIPATVPAARFTQTICAHPLLRLLRPPASRCIRPLVL